MMTEYVTIRHGASYTFEDRKSVFIGDAMPVSSEKEALDFLQSIKKRYPDANHHVYAYVLRDNQTARFSDDKEPQGTAGLPVLDMIRKTGLTDMIIVVTRYFGGTLLGTGGLVHAYSEAAHGAVDAAEIVTCALQTRLRFTLSYSDYQKVLPFLASVGFTVENTEFESDVTVTGKIKKERLDIFKQDFSELFFGKNEISEIEEFFSS